jgi:hypothetical protein
VAVSRPDDDPDAEALAAISSAVRDALADAVTRREVVALLTGEADRRDRRLAKLAEELDGYELTWKRRDDEGTGRGVEWLNRRRVPWLPW